MNAFPSFLNIDTNENINLEDNGKRDINIHGPLYGPHFREILEEERAPEVRVASRL